MAPTPSASEPQQKNLGERYKRLPSESIVISGMSGLFPQAHSVKEFSDILYNKINPSSKESRSWKWSHPEAPEYMGKVPDIHLFDSRFFMVHHHLGNCMDPMARKLLEHAYQAIYDAGISPKHLNGKKIGVYIAAALSDTEKDGVIDLVSHTGFGITGCSKTMYANRISYWLNAKGPSITIDDACCGFTVALEQAYRALNEGTCEAAIVGGASACLYPHAQVHYSRCIKMSPDETTKSFDNNANGCVKSEALSVIFLQKAKDALRGYAELVLVKNNFISKLSGETGQIFGFVRNPNATAEFLNQFYHEAGTLPQTVEYIEAFGSATPEADKAELEAIEKVFCEARAEPLFVGSVISNVGYTEAASGGTAITKVLLGYHNSLVASNLHCDTPRQDVAAIRDGRMCVLREHLPFRGQLAALNCLSLTGVNSHLLLRRCTHDKLKSRPIDPEELALLLNIHSTDISGHLGRGYNILGTENNKHFDDSQRPLWFVYSGMGSQWVGMGAALMRIPIFKAAIQRCHTVLKPKGINIVDIITSSDKTTFDNILHSFVGIAAIQIGLTDILTALGLRPDKIIGHSVGELGCAYADGCLTAEEMILSAYSRGRASADTPLIKGAMAAVGIGYAQLSRRCPSEIAIACHNSSESSTLSGPADKLREFVASLTAEGIFARQVPCSNIAYHSQYVSAAGPLLLRLLSDIIVKPRARSARWLSTSVPPERWDEPIAQYCSAEYLTNNLLSSVYFEETCSLMESNGVVVEVAPHGLLQAILRRSLPQTCTNIPLAQRNHPDNVHFLLDAIGKLYIQGYTPNVKALYPRVEFPVSTGTPHLSHLVKWYHEETWTVSTNYNERVRTSSSANYVITNHDDQYTYLKGNVVQGRVLYPFAATLVTVWDTLAMSIGRPKKNISVRFEDVFLYSQPVLHDQKSLKLHVSINKGNGRFEVLEGDSKVAEGFVAHVKNPSSTLVSQYRATFKDLAITSEEIYNNFASCGYSYMDEFRSILCVDESLSEAQLVWNNNWVTMVDGLLQLNVLRHAHVTQPTHIRNITIDIRKHKQQIQNSLCVAVVDNLSDVTSCGGIMIHNITFRNITMSFYENKFKLIPMLSANEKLNVHENELFDRNDVRKGSIALQIESPGDLWQKVPEISGNGIDVIVEYAGINMADVTRATRVPPENYTYGQCYGLDFSGLTKSGTRVMGICCAGSARSVVRVRSELLWPVPAHWSLEDAATVPLAYLQAYYCLFIRSQLRSGSRVLIHGGAGALGQAAISIALAHGCQVFTTVSDMSKKRHLLKLFPDLNDNFIGNSRHISFGDMVMSATNNEGCEIILSCVRGNLKDINLKCASTFAVIFDTAQIQYQEKYDFGMYYMMSPRSYILVDTNSILDSERTENMKRLQLLLSEGISRGEVRPLSRVCYSGREATRAFRLLAASRHRGRVLLRLRDSMHPTHNSFICSPERNHIMIWDGSSLGLQFANRLVSCGVRKLRLQCSKPISDHRIKLGLWQKLGVDVQIHTGGLSSSDDVRRMLTETSQRGAVEAIYVIAADAGWAGTEAAPLLLLLDAASRDLCPHLQYFGVISVDYNLGQETCISRSKCGYAATALILPAYKNSDEEINNSSDKSSWIRGISDVITRALASEVPVQVAQPLPSQKPSLLSLIAVTPDNSASDFILRDITDTDTLPLIKSLLNDYYQLSYDDEKLLNLTKDKIMEIEKIATEYIVESDEEKGLGIFFSDVNVDELIVNADYIPMDTLVHEVKSMDDAIDTTKTHLFIIPGVEGQYGRFRTLCEHLKLPAFVLQPGLDRPTETVTQLAHRYAEILLQTFKLKKTFYILGYEFGVLVALELAGILEDNGLSGTIFCIGDGPPEMQATLERALSAWSSEEELQSGVARHMLSLMCSRAAAAASMEHCLSWSERVEACVRACCGRVSHSAQYIRALVEAAYARISTVRRYSGVARTLRSRLVLLRASASVEEACSLQRYSCRSLEQRRLRAPMHAVHTHLAVPAIINSYLDRDILDIYCNSNLCTTYTF